MSMPTGHPEPQNTAPVAPLPSFSSAGVLNDYGPSCGEKIGARFLCLVLILLGSLAFVDFVQGIAKLAR
jgi:hypothetical protein